MFPLLLCIWIMQLSILLIFKYILCYKLTDRIIKNYVLCPEITFTYHFTRKFIPYKYYRRCICVLGTFKYILVAIFKFTVKCSLSYNNKFFFCLIPHNAYNNTCINKYNIWEIFP